MSSAAWLGKVSLSDFAGARKKAVNICPSSPVTVVAGAACGILGPISCTHPRNPEVRGPGRESTSPSGRSLGSKWPAASCAIGSRA